jgi:hypothetical protein
MDRYGFPVRPDIPVSKNEAELVAKEKELERKREGKWLKMFRKPSKYFKKDRSKMENRILKGIPDSVRSRAWRLIIDPGSINPAGRRSIDQLVSRRCDEGAVRQITLDLHRTLPQVPAFTPAVQGRLKDVLVAYANSDRELGYTQGMSAIAAPLLLYMDVEEAFYCFKSLMSGKHYMFRDLYTAGFPKLFSIKTIWENLLHSKYPKVLRFLNDNSIKFENYGMAWFMTAFMGVELVPVLTIQIYDRFTGFGTRALLSFGLTIIKRLKKRLVSVPMEVAIDLVRAPGFEPEMLDWRAVRRTWDELWLTEKVYHKLFKSAKIEPFP